MRSRDPREIKRGLNRERFRNGRMRIFPVGERTFRLAPSELAAGTVDQGAGLAMDAGDGIGAKRSNRAKALEQNVIVN